MTWNYADSFAYSNTARATRGEWKSTTMWIPISMSYSPSSSSPTSSKVHILPCQLILEPTRPTTQARTPQPMRPSETNGSWIIRILNGSNTSIGRLLTSFYNYFLKQIAKPMNHESIQLTVDPKQTFLRFFYYFWEHFGMMTEDKIIINTATLLDPWKPHKGMEVLIDRFDQVQIYKNLLDGKTLINYFMGVINIAGKYTRVYKVLTFDQAPSD